MKRSIKDKVLPEVTDRLKDLGRYIRIARKRRNLSMAEVAVRLNIGYQTVVRIERGDSNVSVAAYLSMFWLFGLDRQVLAAAHPDRDETGKALEISRLPQRVRGKERETMHDF